jgi:hypothetical protein
MQGEFGNFLPLTALFAPDEDFGIIRGGSNDVAIFGVSLEK